MQNGFLLLPSSYRLMFVLVGLKRPRFSKGKLGVL